MLRDDAIRDGLLRPNKKDIERMKLTEAELDEIKALHKQNLKNAKEEGES